MAVMADRSKMWHIVLRCTICGPFGPFSCFYCVSFWIAQLLRGMARFGPLTKNSHRLASWKWPFWNDPQSFWNLPYKWSFTCMLCVFLFLLRLIVIKWDASEWPRVQIRYKRNRSQAPFSPKIRNINALFFFTTYCTCSTFFYLDKWACNQY